MSIFPKSLRRYKQKMQKHVDYTLTEYAQCDILNKNDN